MSPASNAVRGPRADEQMVARLLAGLEEAIRDRGYTAVTVADIVAAASTSKRAFYENFATKGDCLLEHHRRFHAGVMAEIAREAPRAESSFEETVVGVEIYFRAFVTKPHLARAHLLDVLTVGRPGVEARAEATWRYVRGMQEVMATERGDRPAKVLDDARALGILGGINEIALDMVARDEGTLVDDAVERAVEFVRSIIRDLPTVGEAGSAKEAT
ncbi:TetR/AcrR family transcriptional regulator [Aeromicrobium sp. CTD01-1L150]|uniref:TetR/AcrR family transcriptional regulator n=1 Tax=Aeromicrobium sp. CTD01-1L150 TaxID=3341830 RepID=UPI0035C03A9E